MLFKSVKIFVVFQILCDTSQQITHIRLISINTKRNILKSLISSLKIYFAFPIALIREQNILHRLTESF